uniref:TLC domain-containing protein n=1 Tax=Caenorhabditis japonica TaxID=281687 RepID=A0A8R1HRT6_CAEJA
MILSFDEIIDAASRSKMAEALTRWQNGLNRIQTAPFHFFAVDNNTDVGVPNTAGTELEAPSYWGFVNSIFLPTIVFYTMLWFAVYACVQYNCWLSWQEGIKRKRLLNLSTSLIHSTVSGLYLFFFFCYNTKLMFAAPLHYYTNFDSQIIALSIGYFFYDGMDLVMNDKLSISTGVLLFHHVASIYVLSTAVLSKKFLLYAYWAMLMEVSSIFLHTRSILHISKLSTTSMIGFSKVISYLNLFSFIVFRFFVQFFLFGWAYVNYDHMHLVYKCIAFGGGFCFAVINISLFLRILHSDGFLLSSVVSQDRLDALLEDNEYSNSSESVAKSEKKELLDV